MSRFLHTRYAGLETYTPGEQPRDKQYIKLNTNAFKLFTFFILKSCMIIRKLIITYFLSFNIVVQYNSDTMDF